MVDSIRGQGTYPSSNNPNSPEKEFSDKTDTLLKDQNMFGFGNRASRTTSPTTHTNHNNYNTYNNNSYNYTPSNTYTPSNPGYTPSDYSSNNPFSSFSQDSPRTPDSSSKSGGFRSKIKGKYESFKATVTGRSPSSSRSQTPTGDDYRSGNQSQEYRVTNQYSRQPDTSEPTPRESSNSERTSHSSGTNNTSSRRTFVPTGENSNSYSAYTRKTETTDREAPVVSEIKRSLQYSFGSPDGAFFKSQDNIASFRESATWVKMNDKTPSRDRSANMIKDLSDTMDGIHSEQTPLLAQLVKSGDSSALIFDREVTPLLKEAEQYIAHASSLVAKGRKLSNQDLANLEKAASNIETYEINLFRLSQSYAKGGEFIPQVPKPERSHGEKTDPAKSRLVFKPDENMTIQHPQPKNSKPVSNYSSRFSENKYDDGSSSNTPSRTQDNSDFPVLSRHSTQDTTYSTNSRTTSSDRASPDTPYTPYSDRNGSNEDVSYFTQKHNDSSSLPAKSPEISDEAMDIFVQRDTFLSGMKGQSEAVIKDEIANFRNDLESRGFKFDAEGNITKGPDTSNDPALQLDVLRYEGLRDLLKPQDRTSTPTKNNNQPTVPDRSKDSNTPSKTEDSFGGGRLFTEDFSTYSPSASTEKLETFSEDIGQPWVLQSRSEGNNKAPTSPKISDDAMDLLVQRDSFLSGMKGQSEAVIKDEIANFRNDLETKGFEFDAEGNITKAPDTSNNPALQLDVLRYEGLRDLLKPQDRTSETTDPFDAEMASYVKGNEYLREMAGQSEANLRFEMKEFQTELKDKGAEFDAQGHMTKRPDATNNPDADAATNHDVERYEDLLWISQQPRDSQTNRPLFLEDGPVVTPDNTPSSSGRDGEDDFVMTAQQESFDRMKSLTQEMDIPWVLPHSPYSDVPYVPARTFDNEMKAFIEGNVQLSRIAGQDSSVLKAELESARGDLELYGYEFDNKGNIITEPDTGGLSIVSEKYDALLWLADQPRDPKTDRPLFLAGTETNSSSTTPIVPERNVPTQDIPQTKQERRVRFEGVSDTESIDQPSPAPRQPGFYEIRERTPGNFSRPLTGGEWGSDTPDTRYQRSGDFSGEPFTPAPTENNPYQGSFDQIRARYGSDDDSKSLGADKGSDTETTRFEPKSANNALERTLSKWDPERKDRRVRLSPEKQKALDAELADDYKKFQNGEY